MKINPLMRTFVITLNHGLDSCGCHFPDRGTHVRLRTEKESGLIQRRTEGEKHAGAVYNAQWKVGKCIFQQQSVEDVVSDHRAQRVPHHDDFFVEKFRAAWPA